MNTISSNGPSHNIKGLLTLTFELKINSMFYWRVPVLNMASD